MTILPSDAIILCPVVFMCFCRLDHAGCRPAWGATFLRPQGTIFCVARGFGRVCVRFSGHQWLAEAVGSDNDAVAQARPGSGRGITTLLDLSGTLVDDPHHCLNRAGRCRYLASEPMIRDG
jgi:hypothetical protein